MKEKFVWWGGSGGDFIWRAEQNNVVCCSRKKNMWKEKDEKLWWFDFVSPDGQKNRIFSHFSWFLTKKWCLWTYSIRLYFLEFLVDFNVNTLQISGFFQSLTIFKNFELFFIFGHFGVIFGSDEKNNNFFWSW